MMQKTLVPIEKGGNLGKCHLVFKITLFSQPNVFIGTNALPPKKA